MSKPKAVVLAAGKGSRLDRVDSPKPLVRVGAEPMLLRVIKQIQDSGIDDVTVVVGHRGDEIKRELIGNSEITADLTFAEQVDDASESGLLNSFLAIEDRESPLLITMADLVFTENPFEHFCEESVKQVNGHEVHTLVCTNLRYAGVSGALSRVDISDARVEKVGKNLEEYSGVEVGAYYVPNGLGVLIDETKKHSFDSLDALLASLASEKRVGYVTWNDSPWFDVNTPATHTRANMLLREKTQVVTTDENQKELRTLSAYSFFDRKKHMKSDVIVERGLVKNIADYEVIPLAKKASTHFLLTDSRVDGHYGDMVLEGLTEGGFNVHKIVVPEGEATKNIEVYGDVADKIFSYGMDKHSIIISLGGGVVNNLAGVLSSTLYRGIELMHIATSSLSQVDAALDFKQAINSRMGKNLIGSYYPASKILIDPEVLKTLDERHLYDGFSESLKHALTQSPEFVAELLRDSDNLKDVAVWENIIKRTITLKVPLLCGDVEDDYNEMLPQYGHSVAHAVEHLSSYGVYHGEAVAIGICVSAEVAKILGFCDDETVDTTYKLFSRYNLPTVVPEGISAEDVLEAVKYDKHYVNGTTYMGLPVAIGEMWHHNGVYSVPVERDTLIRAIEVNKTKA